VPLDVRDRPPEYCLIPAPIKPLSGHAKLNNEVPRKILRLDLAPFLPPKPHQGDLVATHDDPGVRTADKISALRIVDCLERCLSHRRSSSKHPGTYS